MSILPFNLWAASLAPDEAVLAIDHSKKTLGLALSDPRRSMALPLPPLRRQGLRRDLGHLAQVMHDYRVRAVVVGLPLNMDGTQGPRAQAVRAFISTWLADCAQQEGGGGALIITLQDERLSTAEADEAACGLGLRDARRTEALDSLAAVAILERALRRLDDLARGVPA